MLGLHPGRPARLPALSKEQSQRKKAQEKKTPEARVFSEGVFHNTISLLIKGLVDDVRGFYQLLIFFGRKAVQYVLNRVHFLAMEVYLVVAMRSR